MRLTEAQVKSLLTDNVPRQFNQLGLSLLITRLKGLYRADSSAASLQRCTNEINAFLQKFEAIMQHDIGVLGKL